MPRDPFFTGPASPRPAERAATWRELCTAALVAFFACLPFLDKAVTQDDWAYLTVASYAGEDPAAFLAQETLYQGRPMSVARGMLHGPVWIGMIAGCRLLGEEHTLTAVHLLSALLLALLAAATASLAARLGAPPVATALALVLAPGPWLLAGTAMTDLPMLALFVAALAAAAAGQARGSIPMLLAAGLLGALAALTRYYGIAVVPLLLVQPLLWGRVRPASFLPAVVSAAGLAAWLLLSVRLFGAADPTRGLSVLAERGSIDGLRCFQAAVAGLGGMAAGWLVAALVTPRRLLSAVLGDPLLLLVVIGGLSIGAWLSIDAASSAVGAPGGINAALQAAFLMFGGTLVLAVLHPWLDARAWRQGGLRTWRAARGGEAWLGLWLGGFMVAATAFVPFGAARYILPALPAAVLLCALFTVRRLGSGAGRVALVASAALGLGCAVADENASKVNESYGQMIAARRAPGGPWNQTGLWVWGELGFRWYLEHEARALVLASNSTEPVPGDRVLRSATCTAATMDGRAGVYTLAAALLATMYAEDHEIRGDAWPFRVHNPRAAAGFYHSDSGLLPFALSRAPHDEFQTWLVKEPSLFLETFAQARLETPDEERVAGGNIRVERFVVRPELATFPAVKFFFPGRATWPSVLIPQDEPWLTLRVGEHYRVVREGFDGPGVILRVLVDSEVVHEERSDVRRREADRRWFDVSIDLSARAGREVAITFEVEALPGSTDPGQPARTIAGFADPRFSVEPLPGPGDSDDPEDG